jgi:hypothetical protein
MSHRPMTNTSSLKIAAAYCKYSQSEFPEKICVSATFGSLQDALGEMALFILSPNKAFSKHKREAYCEDSLYMQ